MIIQKLYNTSSLLLIAMFILVSSSFAQNCDPLDLDSIGNPGEYTIGSLTEPDGIRDGPDYDGATIYFPTNATPPYASMVIVPGYVSAQSTIQNWGPFLASPGIVTMTIGTNSIWEYPEERKDALLDAIITLKEENTRTGSPLMGQLDVNNIAVGGWSMGGGGAQLAAVADPSITAVMALCPWLQSGTYTAADLNHAAPILFFSAENDGVAPPASHADIHYDYTPIANKKMLFEIAGGGHQEANDPIGGGDYVGKIAVAWLNNVLVGDTCYCPLVLDTPPTASKYLLNIECAGVVSVNEMDKTEMDYHLYPNPSNGEINLEVQHLEQGTNYQIFSITGALLEAGSVKNISTNISMEHLAPGTYIFQLSSHEQSSPTKFVVE
jgi:hypothetical protein